MNTIRKNLSENIRNWARDRKIIPNSNLKAQYLKLCEELGELVLGVRKEDKELIIDSIGDIYVVATILLGLNDEKIEDIELVEKEYYKDKRALSNAIFWLQNSIGDLAKAIIRDKTNNLKDRVNFILDDLEAVARCYNLNLDNCITASWNEIKDRKGYLREDGIFVKESDIK